MSDFPCSGLMYGTYHIECGIIINNVELTVKGSSGTYRYNKGKSMTDTNNTQPQEVKTEGQDTKPEQKIEDTKVDEQPVGEILKTTPAKSQKPDSVPFAVFEALKKDMKELKAQVDKQNQPKIDDDDLQQLAEKYQVDGNFLNELAGVIDKKNAAKYGSEIDNLKQSSHKTEIDQAFKTAYKSAISRLPEYKDIVNQDVIKGLSMLPENSTKTFSQLIKETYGNAIVGKKTMEPTTPGSGKESDSLDFAKAQKDPEYFKEVMKDPAMKKEYNAKMIQSVNF